MTKIDHAAVRTAHYEEAQKFFEDVFDMHMWREIGEKPGLQMLVQRRDPVMRNIRNSRFF